VVEAVGVEQDLAVAGRDGIAALGVRGAGVLGFEDPGQRLLLDHSRA
jgi:hypothetical protein